MSSLQPVITGNWEDWWMAVGSFSLPKIIVDPCCSRGFTIDQFWFCLRSLWVLPQHIMDFEPLLEVVLSGSGYTDCLNNRSLMIKPNSLFEIGACLLSELSLGSVCKLKIRVSYPCRLNILKIHKVMATKSKIYLVMEFVSGGELFTKVLRRGRLIETPLVALPEQLSNGLLHTACGTPAFTAPKVVRRKGYDGSKADAWSCKLLDPNPDTRMSLVKLMEMPWLKRSLSVYTSSNKEQDSLLHGRKLKHDMVCNGVNAFDIISLSSGLDLSSLFEGVSEVNRKEKRYMSRG
ncbi:hypothetical protein GQ457_12G001570 [Hibiscus cannabinus]